jgi:FMN phosphatase YigB (HAD superfamily)
MNDVMGAAQRGIGTIWLNRQDKRKRDGVEPDYMCKDLVEAKETLLRLCLD